jgi:hypothetical protein
MAVGSDVLLQCKPGTIRAGGKERVTEPLSTSAKVVCSLLVCSVRVHAALPWAMAVAK